jgi:hypothetical protein
MCSGVTVPPMRHSAGRGGHISSCHGPVASMRRRRSGCRFTGLCGWPAAFGAAAGSPDAEAVTGSGVGRDGRTKTTGVGSRGIRVSGHARRTVSLSPRAWVARWTELGRRESRPSTIVARTFGPAASGPLGRRCCDWPCSAWRHALCPALRRSAVQSRLRRGWHRWRGFRIPPSASSGP